MSPLAASTSGSYYFATTTNYFSVSRIVLLVVVLSAVVPSFLVAAVSPSIQALERHCVSSTALYRRAEDDIVQGLPALTAAVIDAGERLLTAVRGIGTDPSEDARARWNRVFHDGVLERGQNLWLDLELGLDQVPWELGASREGLSGFGFLHELWRAQTSVDKLPVVSPPSETAGAEVAHAYRREMMCSRLGDSTDFYWKSGDFASVDTRRKMYPFFPVIWALEAASAKRCVVRCSAFLLVMARTLRQLGALAHAKRILRLAERLGKAPQCPHCSRTAFPWRIVYVVRINMLCTVWERKSCWGQRGGSPYSQGTVWG